MIKNQLLQDFEEAEGSSTANEDRVDRPTAAATASTATAGAPAAAAATANSPTGSAAGSFPSEDPLPAKLMDTVYARLKSDAITCSLIAVVTFFIHWSGFFHK